MKNIKNIIIFILLVTSSLNCMGQYNSDITVLRAREKQSGAYWVDRNIPSTLSPYLWLDASDKSYFINTNNNTPTCVTPNSFQYIKTWLDRSGNNRHFNALTGINPETNSNYNYPLYKCDSTNPPYYLFDSFTYSISNNECLQFNFNNDPSTPGGINGDFTFIFIMRTPIPFNSLIGQYNSFIANNIDTNYSDGHQSSEWQISTKQSNDTNMYFICEGINDIILGTYDQQTHVYEIRRQGNSVIGLRDGVLKGTVNTTNTNALPRLQILNLFKNRKHGTNISAQIFECFVFSGSLTANERFELNQYIFNKWGV